MNDEVELFPLEPEAVEYDRTLRRNRDTFDSQKLIRDLLATPMDDGMTYGPSDNVSFKKLTTMNLDVQTRILTRMAYQAASGDVKSAEFLFKYGGLEPPKEQTLTVQTPTFIDSFSKIVDTEVSESEDDEDEYDDGDDVPLLEAGDGPEDDGLESELDIPVVIEPSNPL